MFIPSSGLNGGVIGRCGVPNENGEEVEAAWAGVEAAGSLGLAPKVNIEPDEDEGA